MTMVSEPGRDEAQDSPHGWQPPFRLRHLLGLMLLASVGSWIWPRGHAAWQLHNLGVAYANYALCMVGPTGPELLRENPAAFTELVRRRVIASMPETQPIAGCQELSEQIGVGHRSYRLHGARAVELVEYHNVPGHSGSFQLADLDLSLGRLDALAERAWPFVRSGAEKLMKPSSHAKEASHTPTAPPVGVGTGLPAQRSLYRSTAAFGDTVVVALGSGANASVLMSKNGGIDWTRGGDRLASEIHDRCVADDEGRAFTLSRMSDGRRIVISQGPGAPPQVAALGPAEEELAGISCDESALVAALVLPVESNGQRPLRLRLCPFRRPCQDMVLPALGGDKLYYPADVARVGGDTVLARSSGGITRVASSRDDGRSWTPWTVAFDALSTGSTSPAPFRLLVVADDLLLYSGAQGGGSYPLLVSADHGASFHAPDRSQTDGAGDPSALATRL